METRYILLVDDDEDDQLIFKDALQEICCTIGCATAPNGQEAYQLICNSENLPELIFLDLNMPFMNGFEFLGMIKKEQRYKNIPIIIYTTSDNPADMKITLESGAHLYFTKTSDFKLLKNKLEKILAMNFA